MAPACHALSELYQEWKELSEAEGQAIQQARWQDVDQAQTAKLNLQPKIIEATALWEYERQSQPDTEKFVRSFLTDLIEIERRNGDLLAIQRQIAGHEHRQLNRTARTLKHVQSSYGTQAAAHWNSYS